MTVPPSRTALLVMDVQHGIVDRIDDADVLLERLAAALDAGRGAGATVVYVKIGFRAGHPEISPRNRTFSGIASSGAFVLSTLRAAADLDFAITVLRDGCADADPEVDRVLHEKVFPRQAEVTTVAEWAAEVGSA